MVQKWVFHVAPINVKFGMGSGPLVRHGGADHRSAPVPNFTFIGAKMWQYSPKNCQNFEFWPEICTSGATRLQYFYEILSVCTSLQVAFNFLVWSLSTDKHPSYKHFPAVGAFSHKFLIAPSGETTDRIKKIRGAKTGRTSSITRPSMVGILGRAPVVDKKV